MKKKCKVILLESPTGILTLGEHIQWNIPGKFRGTKFHLYLVSDDEIQVDDYFLSDERLSINEAPKYTLEQCIGIDSSWILGTQHGKDLGHNPNWSKKVICSTDSSLNLPIISQSFVEEYVESNGSITEVMIKSEELLDMKGKKCLCFG